MDVKNSTCSWNLVKSSTIHSSTQSLIRRCHHSSPRLVLGVSEFVCESHISSLTFSCSTNWGVQNFLVRFEAHLQGICTTFPCIYFSFFTILQKYTSFNSHWLYFWMNNDMNWPELINSLFSNKSFRYWRMRSILHHSHHETQRGNSATFQAGIWLAEKLIPELVRLCNKRKEQDSLILVNKSFSKD